MKNLNSEKGAALIVVLLTIVVIGLMSVALVNQVMGSHVQGQRAEEKVIASNNAFLGQKHFRSSIVSKVEGQSLEAKDLLEVLNTTFKEHYKVLLGSLNDQSYEVIVEDISLVADNTLNIRYSTKGIYKGYKSNQEEILMLHKVQTEEVGKRFKGKGVIDQLLYNNGHPPPDILRGPIQVNTLKIVGNNNILNINGDLKVNKEIQTSAVGIKEVNIFGDFYVSQGAKWDLKGAICVEGDLIGDFEGINTTNEECGIEKNTVYYTGELYKKEGIVTIDRWSVCSQGAINRNECEGQ
ncbi:type II secretion system protein [Alteribacter aurantiacus]|uniref:type II secretion system protein n=1 Tax=Alteribacter aurantiacus TaxID=254410 RepID=UPI0003FA46E2|nr:type II secretion system protein [Alteribacter aurantiacus]